MATETEPGQAIDVENLKWAEVAALGDVVIVLRDGGRSGVAYIRGNKVPHEVRASFGEKEDPPQSIRQVTIRAGWTRPAWRGSPLDARRIVGVGTELWRRLAGHRDA